MEAKTISPIIVTVKIKPKYEAMYDPIMDRMFHRRLPFSLTFGGEKKEVTQDRVQFYIFPVEEELELINNTVKAEELEWMEFRGMRFEGGDKFEICNPFSNFSL